MAAFTTIALLPAAGAAAAAPAAIIQVTFRTGSTAAAAAAQTDTTIITGAALVSYKKATDIATIRLSTGWRWCIGTSAAGSTVTTAASVAIAI